MWNCICDCGNRATTSGSALTSLHSKSCGCLRNKTIGNKYERYDGYIIGYVSNTEHKFFIDEYDYDTVSKYTWYENYQGYICSMSSGKNVRLHRLVMGNPDLKFDVDHIKHNTLDNRKSQLRICEHQKNTMNHKKHKHNSSGISGVYFDTTTSKWRASIKHNQKNINLGRFSKIEEAIKARKEAEDKYFQEYSYEKSMGR